MNTFQSIKLKLGNHKYQFYVICIWLKNNTANPNSRLFNKEIKL